MQRGCCTGDEDSDSPHALCCGATRSWEFGPWNEHAVDLCHVTSAANSLRGRAPVWAGGIMGRLAWYRM